MKNYFKFHSRNINLKGCLFIGNIERSTFKFKKSETKILKKRYENFLKKNPDYNKISFREWVKKTTEYNLILKASLLKHNYKTALEYEIETLDNKLKKYSDKGFNEDTIILKSISGVNPLIKYNLDLGFLEVSEVPED